MKPASMDTVFLFSGQGSQYFRMGSELLASDAVFRGWMHDMDAIVRNTIGESVIDALYSPDRDKADLFDRLRLTHPAIFMVEYALAQALIAAGLRPDRVVGVSMGSFAAAAVAERITVQSALRATIEQAVVLESRCENGGMLAIMADPRLFEEPFIENHCELAAVNFDGHFTISAPCDPLEAIEAELKRRSVACFRLPVRIAFHSRWMDGAAAWIDQGMPRIATPSAVGPQLVCSERAEAVGAMPPDDFFWRVVRRRIRFRETIAWLESCGPHRYVDAGPAGTLATFLKYGLPRASQSSVHAILTPFGRDTAGMASVLAAVEDRR
jgi:bacillaene synthase trans-acting acyltransferase